jgi:hypothetical protein
MVRLTDQGPVMRRRSLLLVLALAERVYARTQVS